MLTAACLHANKQTNKTNKRAHRHSQTAGIQSRKCTYASYGNIFRQHLFSCRRFVLFLLALFQPFHCFKLSVSFSPRFPRPICGPNSEDECNIFVCELIFNGSPGSVRVMFAIVFAVAVVVVNDAIY